MVYHMADSVVKKVSLKKLPKFTSYKEAAYQAIKQAIIEQKFKQGEQLNERTLSSMLGISRTPIREALHLLVNDGWIISEPFKGTWVRKISTDDIEQAYQMRLALEPLAVELAIQNLTPEGSAYLQNLLEKHQDYLATVTAQKHGISMEEIEKFTEFDMALHLYIAELSGNRILYQTMNSLLDILNIHIIQMIRSNDRYLAAGQEHERLLKAILAKDCEKAKQLIIEHAANAKKSMEISLPQDSN